MKHIAISSRSDAVTGPDDFVWQIGGIAQQSARQRIYWKCPSLEIRLSLDTSKKPDLMDLSHVNVPCHILSRKTTCCKKQCNTLVLRIFCYVIIYNMWSWYTVICTYIYGPVLRLSTPPLPPPPHGLGPQVPPPLSFYLQAIGSISEVQLRIC